ncbi:cystathionine beta-synthase [Bizionia sediminis]|uniref:Cystathionine beta-synthase n=1 Tax=Bizionia sediminis TaxID=1737064 RepID=A0ABW5KRX9_9FLAO
MQELQIRKNIQTLLANMPADWLELTTHRLDIYTESQAKTEFLEALDGLIRNKELSKNSLNNLPTAYDYIRLGHPLSCVLEYGIATAHNLNYNNVVSFDSQIMPILAILRANLLQNKKTEIMYSKKLPESFHEELLQSVYGYNFTLLESNNTEHPKPNKSALNTSTVYINFPTDISALKNNVNADFVVNIYPHMGSILIINGSENDSYISEIQHVRRRETVAMTPKNTLKALQLFASNTPFKSEKNTSEDQVHFNANKSQVLDLIKEITNSNMTPLVATSGLSMQYAIMMGLVHYAQEHHPGKPIKFIVPPNCYGGTNDQARRVAKCLPQVEIVDLLVDGEYDMVQSLNSILNTLALENAIPFIIAEIPTNPRVEVPNLNDLRTTLSTVRKTADGNQAVEPVFILDQTFCPNVHFLGPQNILSYVPALSYASGSKFPSGGKCTAGYCTGNSLTTNLLAFINKHLLLCDNEATAQQYAILAQQLPSMNKRIQEAYVNTRDFVNFIEFHLPAAKINFVSPELAQQGFTPSVFSLDLPTKGQTPEEKEAFKRDLNLKLINLMIAEIPNESKFCVSYGQLKGVYWTIPATSTQGTTKEGDKDYIVRASLSGNMDLEQHKKVFLKFISTYIS